jgi:hypothetical protein
MFHSSTSMIWGPSKKKPLGSPAHTACDCSALSQPLSSAVRPALGLAAKLWDCPAILGTKHSYLKKKRNFGQQVVETCWNAHISATLEICYKWIQPCSLRHPNVWRIPRGTKDEKFASFACPKRWFRARWKYVYIVYSTVFALKRLLGWCLYPQRVGFLILPKPITDG